MLSFSFGDVSLFASRPQLEKKYGIDNYIRPVAKADARPSSLGKGIKEWNWGTKQHALFSRALYDFILLDGHPVSAVEGEGLIALMHKMEPRFVPPSRPYFQQV